MRAAPLWLSLCLAALPGVPAAADCPEQDTVALGAVRDPLFEALKAAATQAEGQEIADRIWISWMQAPDDRAQDLLDTGRRRIRIADYAEAKRLLDALVAYCPAYPEGWNQRAFARFLAGDLDGALTDLDRTLELEPRHFGALAGKGVVLLQQGRVELARQALRDAVAINPWINERALLVEPPGQKT